MYLVGDSSKMRRSAYLEKTSLAIMCYLTIIEVNSKKQIYKTLMSQQL